MNFSEFGFTQGLTEGLEAMGYQEATPIQAAAIPIIQTGHDLIGCAQTGTGKTAAFLLPILDRLCRMQNAKPGTRALIIVPTRELAVQIDQQVEGLAYFINVTSKAVYGGNDGKQWDAQRNALDLGTDILVATPGRLIQFLQLGMATLGSIETLVLDEADRMLDMGFFPDIERILKELHGRKQTLLFSATMPPEVKRLAEKILHQPEMISLAVSKPAERIKQQKTLLGASSKIPALVEFFAQRSDVKSAIIFAEKKTTVRELAIQLHRRGLQVVSIHSDLEQGEREQALQAFKAHEKRILVATDIVARGIDIEDVDLVVNFNVPQTAEAYVHRVGRTARAAQSGEALTLVSADDAEALRQVEAHLGAPIPSITLERATPYTNDDRRGKRSAAPQRRGGGSSQGHHPSPQKHQGKPSDRHHGKPHTANRPSHKNANTPSHRTPKRSE